MRRLLVLFVALLLALLSAPAFAQDEEDDPVLDDPTEQVDPEDEEDLEDVEDEEDSAPDDASDYSDYCDYADYTDYQDYGAYCRLVPNSAGGGPREKSVDEGGEPASGTAPVVQTLPASSLPLTGSEPLIVALIGLSLVSIGVGGRRLTARSE